MRTRARVLRVCVRVRPPAHVCVTCVYVFAYVRAHAQRIIFTPRVNGIGAAIHAGCT